MSEPTQCPECAVWSPLHDPGDARCVEYQHATEIAKQVRRREAAEARLAEITATLAAKEAAQRDVEDECAEMVARLAEITRAVEGLAQEWEREREEWRRRADDAYLAAREGRAGFGTSAEHGARGATCREHAAALRSLLSSGAGEGR